MALITCHECGNQVSATAKACPQCGATGKALGDLPRSKSEPEKYRGVSFSLIIGIFLMPYAFAWLLLRRGYSTRARILGLGWLALLILSVAFSQNHGTGVDPGDYKPDNPDLKRNNLISDLSSEGEVRIRSMLKDEDSAQFKGSEGRISHGERISCGYVNSKNSFGAMAGYTGWVVRFDVGKAYMETPIGDNTKFASIWNKFCVGKQDPIDDDTSAQHVALKAIEFAGFSCTKLNSAQYLPDGSIKAICSNHEDYRVADLDWKYVAIRCSAARKYGIKGC